MRFSRLHPVALGVLGLIPFAGLAFGVYASQYHADFFARALAYYGATILAFLGGIHWGVAVQKSEPAPAYLYVSAVLPQLLGFGALVVESGLSLLLIAAGLLGIFAIDILYGRLGLLPRWFLKLRLVLTAGATASMAAAFWAYNLR